MTLHILPACDLTEDDGPDVECLVCEDTGEFIPEGSDLFMPCPDPLLTEAKREALREAATEWAEGAWSDQWSADRVDDDVSAVQSTERWLLARAEQVRA